MKFEINEWKTQLTDEEIIADIKKRQQDLAKIIFPSRHISRRGNIRKLRSKRILALGKML